MKEQLPGEAYLQMSEQNIIPALGNIFYDNEAYYVQEDGSPPHYHRVVRAILITIFLSDGSGEEEVLQSTHHSVQILPFYETVYVKKPRNLQHLQRTITNSFNDIPLPLHTVNLVYQSVLARCVRCIAVIGNYYEHL